MTSITPMGQGGAGDTPARDVVEETPPGGVSSRDVLVSDPEVEDVSDLFSDADLSAARRAGLTDAAADELLDGDIDLLDEPWRDEPGTEIETPWLGVLRGSTRTARPPSACPTAAPGGRRPRRRPAGRLAGHPRARPRRDEPRHPADGPPAARRDPPGRRREHAGRTWRHRCCARSASAPPRPATASTSSTPSPRSCSPCCAGWRSASASRATPRRCCSPAPSGDYHSLPLHVLSAALGERDIDSPDARHRPAAARARRPPCAAPGRPPSSSSRRCPARTPSSVEHLRRQRPAPRVVLGGPGLGAVDGPGVGPPRRQPRRGAGRGAARRPRLGRALRFPATGVDTP